MIKCYWICLESFHFCKMVGQTDDSEELLSMASGGDDVEVGDSENGTTGGGKGKGEGDAKEDGSAKDGGSTDKDGGAVGGTADGGHGGDIDDEATFDGDGDGSNSMGVTQATQMMINMKVPPDHLDFATILPSLAEIRGG